MDRITDIEKTSLYPSVKQNSPREFTDTQLQEIARFINDVRQVLKPWDAVSLFDRLQDVTPQEFLEELEFVARNCMHARPVNEVQGLMPSGVRGVQGYEFLGISSRDWEYTVGASLDMVVQGMMEADEEQPPFSSTGAIASVALSQLTNSLHHMDRCSGRLSRFVALMYWPQYGEVTPDAIDRLLHGSRGVVDALRSFTNPTIGTNSDALIHGFGSQQSIVERGGQVLYDTLPIPDISLAFEGNNKAIAQEVQRRVHSFMAPVLGNGQGTVVRSDLENKEKMADLFETGFALVSPFYTYAVLDQFMHFQGDKQYASAEEFISDFAQLARRARIQVALMETKLTVEKDVNVYLNPGHPSHRETILKQYEAGMHWLETGLFPTEQWLANAPHAWAAPGYANILPATRDQVTQSVAEAFGR